MLSIGGCPFVGGVVLLRTLGRRPVSRAGAYTLGVRHVPPDDSRRKLPVSNRRKDDEINSPKLVHKQAQARYTAHESGVGVSGVPWVEKAQLETFRHATHLR